MNQKTAKVLKRFAATSGKTAKEVKKWWLGLNRNEREAEGRKKSARRPPERYCPSAHAGGPATTGGGTRPPAWRTPHSTIARMIGPQVFAFRRQRVLHPRRMRRCSGATWITPAPMSRFSRSARMLVGIPSGELEKLGEPALAANQIADDEQRPAIADHVERARHRAARAPRRGRSGGIAEQTS